MASARFERMINFISRHQLLSSFLCLVTLFLILMAFLIYGHSVENQNWLKGAMHLILRKPRLAMRVFVPMLLLPLPVIVPCILLWLCMGTSGHGNPPLRLFERFILAALPSFCIIFLITGWMSIVSYHQWNSVTLILAPIVSLIYSIVFGIVFGSQSKVSKGMIVIHSIIISSLMGGWFLCLFIFFGMRL